MTIQAQILDLIDDLRLRLQMAVILITHDLGVIAARANRVMVMYAGKIAGGLRHGRRAVRRRCAIRTPRRCSVRFPALRPRPLTGRLFSIPGLPPQLMTPSRQAAALRTALCCYAQARCTQEEPLLAPETEGTRPGAGVEHTDTPTLPHAIRRGEHVFACFYPVEASAEEDRAQSIFVTEREPAPAAAIVEPALNARTCSELDSTMSSRSSP